MPLSIPQYFRRSWVLPSATHVSRSQATRRWKSVWATCPCHVARLVTEFLPLYGSGGGGVTRRFSRVSESSYRAPYLATAPRGPRDRWLKSQTRPHAPGSVSGAPVRSPFSLHTGETTSSVTCGCRKSDDHPAGSCPGSRGQIQARERVAELNAALMTPLTCISG